jgi:hypothetical protein
MVEGRVRELHDECVRIIKITEPPGRSVSVLKGLVALVARNRKY